MKLRSPVCAGLLLVLILLCLYGCTQQPTVGQAVGKPQPPPGAPKPPEAPAAAEKAALSKDDLADAITEYVDKDSKLKGGYFLVYDPVAKKPLALKLDKVHRERLARVGEQTYFACADFTTDEGRTYDLDVFMQGPDKENLTVTEVSVHKEEGVARYGWYEEEGVWKKKPL